MPGKILSLLWTDGDKPASKGDKTPPPEAHAAVPVARSPVVVGSMSGMTATAAPLAPHEDPAIRAQLEAAMLTDGDNTVARFREAVTGLADEFPNDPVRCARTVFKMLKASGLTPEAVMKDLGSDEHILATKQAEFRTFIQGKRESGLGAKQKEVDEITGTIETIKAQIEALQRQIADLTAKQTQLGDATRTEAQKYAKVEADFEATLAAIRAERQQILSVVQPFCSNK